MENNNFLYNHLVSVRDTNNRVYKTRVYNRAVTQNKINRFYDDCIQNKITLKNIILELYLNITEGAIEEFKEKYNIDDFNRLCLLTLAMFYVDYIKSNKKAVSDRIAKVTDFMFDYVSKFEPSIYELKDVNAVPSEEVEIPKIKKQNKKEKVKVMSYPDLILFESISETESYYNCKIQHLIDTGKKCQKTGQTFRRIKK